MAALAIPGPIDVSMSAKLTNTSTNSSTGITSQLVSHSVTQRAKGPNNTNTSDLSDDSQQLKRNQFCALNQSSNMTLNSVSSKPNILQKQSFIPKSNAVQSLSNDNELNGEKSVFADSEAIN